MDVLSESLSRIQSRQGITLGLKDEWIHSFSCQQAYHGRNKSKNNANEPEMCYSREDVCETLGGKNMEGLPWRGEAQLSCTSPLKAPGQVRSERVPDTVTVMQG